MSVVTEVVSDSEYTVVILGKLFGIAKNGELLSTNEVHSELVKLSNEVKRLRRVLYERNKNS